MLTSVALLALVGAAQAAPVPSFVSVMRREVPQEHSHEPVLVALRAVFAKSNPLGISDPVFGLLGNAAAVGGANGIDPDCLQQQTADSAFTVAKSSGDLVGMTNALIYAALERNTGSVGLAAVNCTSVAPTNPQIAAINRHQDPASPGAAANNKASALALAVQLASIGADPTLALGSGTFAPGTIGDPTAKGNSCDEITANGCIVDDKLLVDDVTEAEISAAVAGVTATAAATGAVATDAVATTTEAASSASTVATSVATSAAEVDGCGNPITSSEAVSTAVATATATAVSTSASATSTEAASTGANLQTFTGSLGGSLPPPVTAGGRGFIIAGPGGTQDVGLGAALQHSCDIQNNVCADAANAGGNKSFTVGDCNTQQSQCIAAGSASAEVVSTASPAASAVETSSSVSASSTVVASATSAATSTSAAPTATATAAASSGANLQLFTGDLGGSLPPPVTQGGRGFNIAGANGTSDVGLGAAIQRSCSEQANTCSDAANASGNKTFTVADCSAQEAKCNATPPGTPVAA